MPYAISNSCSRSRTVENTRLLAVRTADLPGELITVKKLEHAAPGDFTRTKINGANTIKRFFRRVVAAQSYGHMFSNGSHFEQVGLALPKSANHHFPFAALTHLEKISALNLTLVSERIGKLQPHEERLQKSILASEWRFRHQSNANLEHDDVLNISSNLRLEKIGKKFIANTNPVDKSALANTDFVFFGVEFSDGEKKDSAPLNNIQGSINLGVSEFPCSRRVNN